MKVCKNCGTQNKDTSLFCEGCGTRLEEAPAVVTPVVEEPAATVVPPVAEPPVTEVPAHEPRYSLPLKNARQTPGDRRAHSPDRRSRPGLSKMRISSRFSRICTSSLHSRTSYQQPAYNAVPQEPQKKNGNWMTITSLILSILSIVCCCLDVFALILAIASIVLAIIALVQHKGNKGMAIASLIVGIIGFLIAVYLLVYAYAILPNNPALQSQIMDLYDELGVTGFIW